MLANSLAGLAEANNQTLSSRILHLKSRLSKNLSAFRLTLLTKPVVLYSSCCSLSLASSASPQALKHIASTMGSLSTPAIAITVLTSSSSAVVALIDADIPTSSRGASARERCRLKSRWAGGSSKSAKRRRSFNASLFKYPDDLHFSPRSVFSSAEFSLFLSHRHQLKKDSKLILSSCFSSRSQLAPRAFSVINLAPGLAFAELKNLLRTLWILLIKSWHSYLQPSISSPYWQRDAFIYKALPYGAPNCSCLMTALKVAPSNF